MASPFLGAASAGIRSAASGMRNISHVKFTGDVYKSKPKVQNFLNTYMIKECAKPGGLDSQGADHAVLSGPLHTSKTDKRFHATFVFVDKAGTPIQTIDPRNGATVNKHHVVIPGVKNAQDLIALAV